MDSTQIMLLNLIDLSSGIFLVATVIYILVLVVEGFRMKRFYFGKLILSLSGFLLVAVVFVFSNFLNSWL